METGGLGADDRVAVDLGALQVGLAPPAECVHDPGGGRRDVDDLLHFCLLWIGWVELLSVAEAHTGDRLVVEVHGFAARPQQCQELPHCIHLLGCIGARDGGVACYPKYSKQFTYCQDNTIYGTARISIYENSGTTKSQLLS